MRILEMIFWSMNLNFKMCTYFSQTTNSNNNKEKDNRKYKWEICEKN